VSSKRGGRGAKFFFSEKSMTHTTRGKGTGVCCLHEGKKGFSSALGRGLKNRPQENACKARMFVPKNISPTGL